eukprot:4626986-Amphidinium_carterae.1
MFRPAGVLCVCNFGGKSTLRLSGGGSHKPDRVAFGLTITTEPSVHRLTGQLANKCSFDVHACWLFLGLDSSKNRKTQTS